jgi:hypothetical protein
MAELNFNALARPGPRGFMQGFAQGQEQRMTEDINRTNLEAGRFKLEELKRDRDEMLQLQEKLKGLGQDPDLDKFMDVYIASGKPDYVKMGLEGKQKLKEQREYAKLIGGGDMTAPEAAPASAAPSVMRMPQAPAPTNALGSGTFGMEAPTNALAVQAPAPAAAAPVNALAAPNAGQIQQTQRRINDLMRFAASNPGMANQAMAQARILQDQLELYSKRNESPDVQTMRALGIPLTPEGYQQYRDAQRQERMLSPAEEAQRIRIANASRAPTQPAQPSAPVAVVDSATGKQVFVSREEALRNRMTPAAAMESLSPKEMQKREAAYPQATSSVKGFESKSDLFIKDLIALRDDKGLDQITGPIYGRTPSVSREGSRAQALYNKIFAKGGFQALQDMRDASKTGGALGNVSNAEGERLERSVVGGLDRTQNAADVKKGINDLIDQIEGSKIRMREAYELMYGYKNAQPAAAGGTWKDL